MRQARRQLQVDGRLLVISLGAVVPLQSCALVYTLVSVSLSCVVREFVARKTFGLLARQCKHEHTPHTIQAVRAFHVAFRPLAAPPSHSEIARRRPVKPGLRMVASIRT